MDHRGRPVGSASSRFNVYPAYTPAAANALSSRNPQGDFFDEEGLEAVVVAREWDSANELLAAIIAAVEEFSAGAPQADDYTVIVLRRKPLL